MVGDIYCLFFEKISGGLLFNLQTIHLPKELHNLCLAFFPGLHHIQLHEEHGGPGIFSLCDVKGRQIGGRKGKDLWALWCSKQQRCQHTYVAYSFRIFFAILLITSCSQDTRLSLLFCTASWVGPGNEAKLCLDGECCIFSINCCGRQIIACQSAQCSTNSH